MIIGNWPYICLLFCWFWPKGWDNFKKKRGQQKVGLHSRKIWWAVRIGSFCSFSNIKMNVTNSWSSKMRLQHRCFPINIGKFLKKLFWRTSAYACFWRDFRKRLIKTFFLERHFQNHPDLVILQKYQSLSNQKSLYI